MSKDLLDGFLADTWWYALSQRMSKEKFEKLAFIRLRQGFSAIQLVVGIPPEVGFENENAKSVAGFAWNRHGKPNEKYLELAYQRINFLNKLGMLVVIYGSWGHQIEWIGKENMIKWWIRIVNKMDGLNVVYCVTGEVDLYVGEERKLLPNKTTDDLVGNKIASVLLKKLPFFAMKFLAFFYNKIKRSREINRADFLKKRKKKWGIVLTELAKITQKPIIVHPTVETGYDSIDSYELLAANTVQTGHSEEARKKMWLWPKKIINKKTKYINLEPWYEGIKDNFWKEDQLFAYWVSMLSGASSFCYGAHGVWNVGDGKFLSHWGGQTFDEATKLDTPRLIGLSHKHFMAIKNKLEETSFLEKDGKLLNIKRFGDKDVVYFFPKIENIRKRPFGNIWLPLEGKFVNKFPDSGQVVVFEKI